MQSCDTIIIGGGTNGLACAFRLAKAGHRVTVLEASDTLGGGANTVEFAPGYRVSGLAHILHMLDPRVAKAMAIGGVVGLPMVTTALSANPLTIIGNNGIEPNLETTEQLRWKTLSDRLNRFATALAPLRQMTPPRLATGVSNELFKLTKIGFGLRRLGRSESREFLRMILINVADVLEDDLTDDRLMGLVALDATLGAWLGPRSPNSLILLLNRLSAGPLTLPRGGMGAVPDAMQKAAKSVGVTIRTSARVARIIVDDNTATGAELITGEVLSAKHVISAINPRTTFETLVGPGALDTGTLRQSRAIRSRGGAAKLHLALTGAPAFKADLTHRLVIAPSVRAVEEAFNPVKYGDVPDRPVMEIVLPSAHEAGFAPPGHHVLSAVVQFAPHAPENPDNARSTMLANTLTILEEHAPGIGKLIAHAELLMPYDIAARYGMAGGNWHHGELSVEQMLFLRPFVGAAQYQTPLKGLWLAGAGSHPGGGVSGTPGWNAAERLLEVTK